jgi:hypothetical protein
MPLLGAEQLQGISDHHQRGIINKDDLPRFDDLVFPDEESSALPLLF